MLAEARAQLAADQARLMEALAGRNRVPEGFDPDSIHVAAQSLLFKRARTVARAWPTLERALGERFEECFLRYARKTPLSGDGTALVDGYVFARKLAAAGELPDDGLLALLATDLRFSWDGSQLARRRGLRVRALRLRQSGRLVVGLYLPGLRLRWLSIPLAWRAHKEQPPHRPGEPV